MSWVVERGIGEERALRIEHGAVTGARLRWPGALEAGMVADAVLVARPAGSTRGRARFASGEEALVSRLPASASEGAPIRLEVTRAAVTERARAKLAQARPTDAPPRPAPPLPGEPVHRFPAGLWEDVWAEAWDARVSFAGGELHFAPSAAMTVVDVDGTLPPRALALAAVPALAAAITRFDLGGVTAIDFPTLPTRTDRQAVDAALATALNGFDHERTAMNGFGLVQIVARSTGPSLLHRLAFDRPGAAARMLVRRGELLGGPGVTLLTAHPVVVTVLAPEWLAELTRRTARPVRTRADYTLAIDAGHAQIVSA